MADLLSRQGEFSMLYKVMKQYARGAETLIAQFNDTADAKLFINAKLIEDARLKVKVTYRLLEGMDVLEEFSDVQGASDVSGVGSAAGSGSQQRSSFQPTPFNMAPRPAGIPHSWVKDDDKKEDDKK